MFDFSLRELCGRVNNTSGTCNMYYILQSWKNMVWYMVRVHVSVSRANLPIPFLIVATFHLRTGQSDKTRQMKSALRMNPVVFPSCFHGT